MVTPGLKGIHSLLMTSDRRKEKNDSFIKGHYERRNDPYALIHVDSPHLFHIFGRLRHQVYIEEGRIPRKEISTIKSSISNIEVDEHDEHSEHYLLVFRPLDLYVGGIRLIFPDPTKEFGGIRPLQLSKKLLMAIGEENINKTFEISRLLISKNRFKLVKNVLLDMGYEENEAHPSPILHLLKPVLLAYLSDGLRYGSLISKKGLLKIINSFGITPITIEEKIQYNGIVYPSFIDIEQQINKLKTRNPKILDFFND